MVSDAVLVSVRRVVQAVELLAAGPVAPAFPKRRIRQIIQTGHQKGGNGEEGPPVGSRRRSARSEAGKA